MAEFPWFTIEEVYPLFGYKNYPTAKMAILRGNFPIKTYKVNKRHVADRVVVQAFFADQRSAGLRLLLEEVECREREGLEEGDRFERVEESVDPKVIRLTERVAELESLLDEIAEGLKYQWSDNEGEVSDGILKILDKREQNDERTEEVV